MTVFKWVTLATVGVLIGCGGGGGGAGGSGGSSGAAGETGGAAGSSATGGGAGATNIGGAAGSAATGGTAGAAGGAGTGGAAGGGGTRGSGGVGGAAGSPGSGGTAGSTGGGGSGCRPDVLLVQDKSGSMSNDENDMVCTRPCTGGTSKWDHMTAAVTEVVQTTDADVNWGLKYFSDNNACDASQPPSVPVAGMNGTAVAMSLQATQPGGNTPTRDAILSATAYLAALPDANPKFLVLATDGLPNCPVGCATMAQPSSTCTQADNPSEDQAAETAVDMAAQMGIKTFVIGVGNVATAQNTLNQLAIAGGEAQTGTATAYFAATDRAAIVSALMNIVGKVTGCR